MPEETKRKRRRLRPWMVLLALLIGVLVYNHWPRSGPWITVSRETTYLTAPLNPDGTVNYVQAVKETYSAGVTFENNAFVLLARAFGPEMFAESRLEESLAELGLTNDPAVRDGPHYTTFLTYTAEARYAETADDNDNPRNAMKGPWLPEDYPLIAAWLETNADHFELIAEASKRTRGYYPMICLENPPCLYCTALPRLFVLRDASQGMLARSMLRTEQGDVDGAIDDILVIHALARPLSSTPNMIQWLVALAMDREALQAAQALTASGRLSIRQAEQLLAHLRATPDLTDMTWPLEVQRFIGLEQTVILYRGGGVFLGGETPIVFEEDDCNWDRMLKEANDLWDRRLDILAIHDLSERQRTSIELDEALEANLPENDSSLAQAADTVLSTLGKALPATDRWRRTRILNRTLLPVTFPNPTIPSLLLLQSGVEGHLAELSLALVIYKHRHGRYPDDLSALSPDILDTIAEDRFAEEPFTYERTGSGCRVYSVGMNLVDDGGLNADDDPDNDGIPEDADDLVIELP